MTFDRAPVARHAGTSDPRPTNHAVGKSTLTEQLPPVQRRAAGGGSTAAVHQAARAGTAGPGTRLPFHDVIAKAFGRHDVSGIQAHVDEAASGAASAMGAEAFATGSHVAFAGTPSLHTAAHEAAHVIQQRGQVSLRGGVGAEGDPYERHADAVADLVVQGKSAERLLDQHAGGGSAAGAGAAVQRKPDSVARNTISIKTDDYRYLINGNEAGQKMEKCPDAGDIRYIRTDGVGDCIAFAMQGTRADGVIVSLFAHLSSQQTSARSGEVREHDYTDVVSDFASGLTDVRARAVTNFVGSARAFNGSPKGRYADLSGDVSGAIGDNLYNTAGKAHDGGDAPYRAFIFDSEEFDIHAAGAVRDGVAAVLESVTEYQKETDRHRTAWQAWQQAQQPAGADHAKKGCCVVQ